MLSFCLFLAESLFLLVLSLSGLSRSLEMDLGSLIDQDLLLPDELPQEAPVHFCSPLAHVLSDRCNEVGRPQSQKT